jgi:hypothetical protein
MPTIVSFQEGNNQYPIAPPSVDIRPEQFGRDAQELAQFGGTLADIGGRVYQARKQAIESDAVASGQTEALLELSKMEDEDRAAYQQAIAQGGDVSKLPSMSEGYRAKTEKWIAERAKGMPSEEAQREFLQRVQPMAAKSYLQNMEWENRTRAQTVIGNIEKRGNQVSQDIYNKPSISRTIDHINALKEDLTAKTGTVLDAEQADKAYKALSKGYAESLFDGLANGTAADTQYGRELLKKMPDELKEHLDSGDIEKFQRKFDQADRERKVQFEIDKSAKKEAQQIQREKAQDEILADIYEGRATVKEILHGKGAILDPDKKQTMLNVLKARQSEPKLPNQNALRGVVSRIYADPEDPKRITSEDQIIKLYTKGELTWSQKQQAINEFRGKNTSAGQIEGDLKKQLFKQAEAALVKKDAMGMADPDGQEQMARFTSFALDEIERAKKAGIPVRDLLDANSKNYLGNSIQNYRKSPMEIMRAQVDRLKNSRSGQLAKPESAAPQPKGTVLMLDPSGRKFFVPEGNAEKAKARGFKVVGSK